MQNSLLGTVPYDLSELAASYRKLADDLERYAAMGPASITSQVTISEWIVAKRAVPALVGKITGHPHIGEGNAGVTTELVYVDDKFSVARTMNRWYRLGSPAFKVLGPRQ
ncbi:hypothetical protein ABIA14_000866 [Sinorhizobium fredii]|uniref:DUF6634 family protein n=1 Tax=Rhizobium fredii TaxID=380 RepID=UPI0035126860